MIRLKMKNYNMILTEKLQKHQSYYQAKLAGVNIILMKKHCLLIKNKQQKKLDLLILPEKYFKNKQN